jgi:hypothetical protein
MSEINANFVVQPFGITVAPEAPGITVSPTTTNLNVFSLGFAQPEGNVGELQFNLNGQVLGGAANTLVSNGNVRFTNISNLKINGGANAYFLQTDGVGNLTWAQGTANVSGNGTAAGANTQIQISDGTGNFTSGAGFTFDNVSNVFTAPGNAVIAGNANVTGNVTANYFIGNGSQLTGIDTTLIQNGSANVRTFANANVTISAAGNANVVVVTGNSFTINGDQFFNGNGAWGAQNMQANYINANYVVGTLTTPAQPNITSVGILSNLDVSGNIVANLLTGTLTTNAQPNITSIGTLVNVSVTGNVIASNVYANSGIIRAFNIQGNTGGFTGNVTANNIVSNLARGNSNISIFGNAGDIGMSVNGNSNVVVVTGNTMNVNGIVQATQFVSNVSGGQPPFFVSGQGLVSNLNSDLLGGYYPSLSNGASTIVVRDANGEIRIGTANANLLIGNFVTGTLTTNAQPNITSLGTLTNLAVTGNVFANSGNIQANVLIGNSVNSSSFLYFSESIELLASNIKLKTASTDRLVLNATEANFNVPIVTNGNVTANYFIGNGALLTGIDTTLIQNGNANVRVFANANVTISAQGNANVVTVTGSSVDIVGNVSANAYNGYTISTSNTANTIAARDTNGNLSANYFIGNGSQLTGVISVIAQTVTNAAQPNITSVGTLTSLAVTGNANAGNVSVTGIFSGNASGLSAIAGGNVTGQVANALVAGTVYTAAQPNITSVGNLTDLRINNSRIHLGDSAGLTNQGLTGVAIGGSAGQANQGARAIALGAFPASNNQGNEAIAIGSFAGSNTQSANGIAIGTYAGFTNQGFQSISIGANTGYSFQQSNAIAIGSNTGINSQGANSIAIGSSAGRDVQQTNSIAIGIDAGRSSQNAFSIAIGYSAGNLNQGLYDGNNIAIGYQAGNANQWYNTIAIGKNAGNVEQKDHSIAIGVNAASNTQSFYSIAIGANAASNNQGVNSIAIGANAGYPNAQANNSIVLNASGANLNAPTANALFIKPIRNANNDQTLVYNATSGEVTYTNYLKTSVTTAAAIGSAVTAGIGARAFVTDANTNVFYNVLFGGGSNNVPVFSDGTNWRIG